VCFKGEWCKRAPIEMPDLPHKHPVPIDTGPGWKMATSTSATWSGIRITPWNWKK